MEVKTDAGTVTVTVPLALAPAAIGRPAASEYTAPDMSMFKLPAAVPAAMVSGRAARVPAPMAVWFSPKTMTVKTLPERLAVMFLPAAVRIGPAAMVPALRPAGSVRLNWRPATDAEPGLNVMKRLTVVPVWPVAVPAARVGAVTTSGALTVKTAALLVTPEAEAVILEVSAAAPTLAPVARPEALIEAAEALLEAHVRVMPAMFAPNWSLGAAVNCWVPLEEIVAAEGVMTMEVRTEAAPLTVKTAALLVTPEAEAVILEVSEEAPVFLPVARPEVLIVAAEALLEPHVIVTPDMVAPNWSLAVAVNC